jgi:hypothetical protein
MVRQSPLVPSSIVRLCFVAQASANTMGWYGRASTGEGGGRLPRRAKKTTLGGMANHPKLWFAMSNVLAGGYLSTLFLVDVNC